MEPTALERTNLEAHVDLCQQRYKNIDQRLTKIEAKVDRIHEDISDGSATMIKVLIGTAGTIIAGLLSTLVVILMSAK